jgi:hypothetical protein
MPSNDPAYEPFYMDNDTDLLGMMQEVYEQNSDQWLQFFHEGDIDTRFYAGDQEAIYNYLANTYNYRRRNQVSFNKIRSIINMISGHQRRNRKTTICIPQEAQDQVTSDQLSNILMYTHTHANAYENISTAFEGALIAGINLIHTWLDYSDDPVNGDIKTNVIPYNAFIIDPYFKKLDFSDCNYIWTRKYLSKKQAKQLLQGREEDIDALHYDGNKDGKFAFMPENINYARKNLIAYDEFWYRDVREEEMLLDENTGETHVWEGDKDSLEQFLGLYPQIKKIKRKKSTVKLGIVLNGRVFYHGENIYNIDRYPFVPFVGYFHPEIECMTYRIQGVVRNLRDLQWAYNRRMRIQLDLLESQITSGLKVMEDSLVDPNDAFLQGQGRVLWVKKEAGLDSVQELTPPQIPPSWFQEVETLNRDMKEITGVTEELLGSSDTDTGITQLLRQGAGLTTLQPILDKVDECQKILGNLFLELIRKNYEAGKLQRISGEELSPMIYNKYFYKFDLQVTEGFLTETQQKMQYVQLLQMQQTGVTIPPEILIKSAPVQDKKELIQAIQNQQQQQQQASEMQMQTQVQVLQAQIKDLEARAAANLGLGEERASRVAENESLAIERRAQAVLDEIKASKELIGLDINQVNEVLGILARVKSLQDIEEKSLQDLPLERISQPA